MFDGLKWFFIFSRVFPLLRASGPEEIFQANFEQKLRATPYSLVKFDGIQDSDPLTNLTLIKLYHEVSEVKDLSIYHVRFSGVQNVKLRKKLKMEAGKLPEIIIYDKQMTELSRYGSKLKVRELIDWIGSKTGLYMNRPGCSMELDQLALGFLSFPPKRQYFFEQIINSNDNKNKDRYAKLIKDFISSQNDSLQDFVRKRLESLRATLKAAKGSSQNGNAIKRQINVAKSFREESLRSRLPVKAKLKTEL